MQCMRCSDDLRNPRQLVESCLVRGLTRADTAMTIHAAYSSVQETCDHVWSQLMLSGCVMTENTIFIRTPNGSNYRTACHNIA